MRITHPEPEPPLAFSCRTSCQFGTRRLRGWLLTKGPDSSFAEANRGFNSEPTHIEYEVGDQEDEVEDGRDCEECKVESRREVRHDTWMVRRALTLEPMSRATLLNMRENTRKCDV